MFAAISLGAALAQAGAGTEVTIYNQGFALVKELRQMQLRQGRQSIAVEDVAQLIETNSVGIKSLTDPTGFEVLEQNYQYDLISPIAILNKAVGAKITFHRVLPNGQKEAVSGVLLSSPTAVVNGVSGRTTKRSWVITSSTVIFSAKRSISSPRWIIMLVG